jgi:hypothetical protein
VQKSLALIEKRYGKAEITFLMLEGPIALLDGRLPETD